MGLDLLDGEGFEVVIVLDRRLVARSGRFDTPSTPGTVAVGKLCYGRYALFLAFRSFFRGHRPEQAKGVAFDCERSAPRLEITCWAMIIKDERGWLRSVAERCDCLDDLPGFRKVVGDSDGPSAVGFAINDFPTSWNSGSGYKSDCQGTKANEKIIAAITLVPGRIEDRDIVGTRLRSRRPTGYLIFAWQYRGRTVHKQSGPITDGVVYQSQEIDWHDARRAHSEILDCLGPVRVRNASAGVSEEGIWRVLAMRREVGFRWAFQVSGKDGRSSVFACVHGVRPINLVMIARGQPSNVASSPRVFGISH